MLALKLSLSIHLHYTYFVLQLPNHTVSVDFEVAQPLSMFIGVYVLIVKFEVENKKKMLCDNWIVYRPVEELFGS